MKRKVYLTFPQKLIREPLIYRVGHEFKVVTNVRCASVTDEIGVVGLELDGEAEEIGRAMEYLKSQGVQVEPVEMNVIE